MAKEDANPRMVRPFAVGMVTLESILQDVDRGSKRMEIIKVDINLRAGKKGQWGAVVLHMLNYLGPHPPFRFVDLWKSVLEVHIVFQRRGPERGIDSTRPAVGGME